jgi:hypothetical protein
MGTKAHGFHSIAPRCVRATRWGRASVTQGDLVSCEGKVDDAAEGLVSWPAAARASVSQNSRFERLSMGLPFVSRWRRRRPDNRPVRPPPPHR